MKEISVISCNWNFEFLWEVKDHVTKTKVFLCSFTTMQEKQILVRSVGIQKENWGSKKYIQLFAEILNPPKYIIISIYPTFFGKIRLPCAQASRIYFSYSNLQPYYNKRTLLFLWFHININEVNATPHIRDMDIVIYFLGGSKFLQTAVYIKKKL